MFKIAKIIAAGMLMATMAASAAQADWHADRGWHGGRDHWRGGPPARVVYVPPPPPRVIYRPYPVYYNPYYEPYYAPPPVIYRSSSFGFWFD